MTHIPPRQMIAFVDELSKEAGPMDFLREQLAGRYGRQLALGAGVGAAGNILRHKIQGDTGGDTLRQGLHGAAVGAGLAGGRILATGAGREAARKSLGNLFQRERYHLTGGGLGKTEAEQLAKAKEIGILHPSASPEDIAHFQKGYMHLPGAAQGLLSKDAPDVLKSSWKRSGLIGKGFLGLGAYQAGKGFVEKPEEGGPGRLEKGFSGLGQAVGGLVTPGGLIAGGKIPQVMGGVAGKIGRLGDVGISALKNRGRIVPAAETQMTGAPVESYGG